ncbi:MAG: EF-P 5-aminopentanol modification-associated protein YfmF [Candidatus Izemoplasmataceae bacterium]
MININTTPKFKTVRMQLSFLAEPTKKEMSARAVLINMMKQQTKTYPTKAKLLNHLHERYNMRLSALPSKIGRVQMLSFTIDFIHSNYTLEDNDMMTDAIEVLESIIKEPLLTEKLFKQEQRILEEYFDSIYADKSHYAVLSMLKHMYKDPINHIDGLGDKEDVKSLIYEDILNAYHHLFDGQVICTVHGDVDEQKTHDLVTNHFSFLDKQSIDYSFTVKNQERSQGQEIIETQNIKQTNLVLGLHMPIYFDDQDYLKARFLNVILGGHSESMLFKEIREKHHMAYYVSSSYDPYQGLLLIQTGIDAKNKEQVLSLIKKTLKNMQTGTIRETVFEQSRKQLRNALIQSQDSQARLTNQATLASLFKIDYSVEQRLLELQAFTKEDIATLSKEILLDTIYVLTGDQHE